RLQGSPSCYRPMMDGLEGWAAHAAAESSAVDHHPAGVLVVVGPRAALDMGGMLPRLAHDAEERDRLMPRHRIGSPRDKPFLVDQDRLGREFVTVGPAHPRHAD